MRAPASTARLVVMAAVLAALPGAVQGCRADGICIDDAALRAAVAGYLADGPDPAMPPIDDGT